MEFQEYYADRKQDALLLRKIRPDNPISSLLHRSSNALVQLALHSSSVQHEDPTIALSEPETGESLLSRAPEQWQNSIANLPLKRGHDNFLNDL